jgi:hypothetical protein
MSDLELDLATYWTDRGNTISTPDDLRAFVSQMRAGLANMTSGLSRAAYGTLHGRPWLEAPADGAVRPNFDDTLRDLDMSVVPPGMTARDATHRQALAGLLAALAAADSAALTAWLACVNADDPDRRA